MACKLCGGSGKKTCQICRGEGRRSGRLTQDCVICNKTGKVTCDCQIVPRFVVRLVAVHSKHEERVVAEREVSPDGDWLPAVIAASQQLNDDISRIIPAHDAWWVEQTEK
ncbi:MAG: hypothetical protein WCP91_03855 [Candidatus Berkelbacteria bacterium]